jgi:hypothetical protein
MKTKPTFLALSLTAAVLIASRERGYAPIIGYVNVPIHPGLNLIANPLAVYTPSATNDANSVLTNMPPGTDGTVFFRFDPSTQRYMDAATYFAGVGWYPLSGNTNDPALVLNPGEGFFLRSLTNADWTLVLVGQVLQGSLTNPIPANWSLKASMIPQAGLLQTDLGFPAVEGDIISQWKAANQLFTNNQYEFSEWAPSQPSITVAESCFVWRDPAWATPDHWWIRNFVVKAATPARLVQKDSGGPDVRSLAIHSDTATLSIVNAEGQPYDVQFSSDGSSWKTLAHNQTGATWTGPCPGGAQGCYRVVTP